VIHDRLHSLLLWFGVLGAPLAWAFQLVAGYGLEEAACGTGTATDDYWGVSALTPIAVVCAVAAATAVASLASAALTHRRVHDRDAYDPRGYARFTSLAGVLASTYFLALIALTTVGVLTLEPCEAA
jgi:hypothetical protein